MLYLAIDELTIIVVLLEDVLLSFGDTGHIVLTIL